MKTVRTVKLTKKGKILIKFRIEATESFLKKEIKLMFDFLFGFKFNDLVNITRKKNLLSMIFAALDVYLLIYLIL